MVDYKTIARNFLLEQVKGNVQAAHRVARVYPSAPGFLELALAVRQVAKTLGQPSEIEETALRIADGGGWTNDSRITIPPCALLIYVALLMRGDFVVWSDFFGKLTQQPQAYVAFARKELRLPRWPSPPLIAIARNWVLRTYPSLRAEITAIAKACIACGLSMSTRDVEHNLDHPFVYDSQDEPWGAVPVQAARVGAALIYPVAPDQEELLRKLDAFLDSECCRVGVANPISSRTQLKIEIAKMTNQFTQQSPVLQSIFTSAKQKRERMEIVAVFMD